MTEDQSTRGSSVDPEEAHPPRGPVIMFSNFEGGYDLTIRALLKLDSPSFVLRADEFKRKLACGRNDGSIDVFDTQASKKSTFQVEQNAVVTNLRWRPKSISKDDVLLAVTSEGLISHYHVESGRPLFRQRQKAHSIMALDYNFLGTKFITAGRDFGIRVYDEATKTIQTKYEAARWDAKGHSNRIFALKFIDNNVFLSGGWDSVLHVWDLRSNYSQKSIYGPNLSGDAIDYRDNLVLTGSHRDKEQIQLIDLRAEEVVRTVGYKNSKAVPYVYSAQFLPKGDIVAGASGLNELRVFGKELNYEPTNAVEMGGGCYSIETGDNWIAYVNSVGDFCVLNSR